MSAPNRSDQVVAVVNNHTELLTTPDGRREICRLVCRALAHTDDGNWGLLLKPPDRIPDDIIVWKPTREHFDILADTGWSYVAAWGPKGIIPDEWQWLSADATPGPSPGPTPTPTPSATNYNDQEVVSFITAAKAFFPTDPGRVAVQGARFEHDANVGEDGASPKVPMGYAAARTKRLKLLEQGGE